MHILLGLLGLIITLLVLLSRLADAGIDFGGLNPFAAYRRRKWRQKFEANPLFSLKEPLEIGAILLVWTAKCGGDMSAEQKQAILELFEKTLGLDHSQAADLLGSSVHLIGNGQILGSQLDDFLALAQEHLSEEQASSVVSLMQKVARVEGAESVQQGSLIGKAKNKLTPSAGAGGTWG